MPRRSVIVPLLLLPFSALVCLHRRSNWTVPELYAMTPPGYTPSTSLLRSKIVVSSTTKDSDEYSVTATARWYAGSKRNHRRLHKYRDLAKRARRHRSQMKRLRSFAHSESVELKRTRKRYKRARRLRRKLRGKKKKGRERGKKAKRKAKGAANKSEKQQLKRLTEQEHEDRKREILRDLKWRKAKALRIEKKMKKLQEAMAETHDTEEQHGRRLTLLAAKKAHTDAALQVLKYQSEYYEYLIMYGPDHILTLIKKRIYEQCKEKYKNKKSVTRALKDTSTETPIKPREIMERSRLVLKWRKYQWTSGARIGRPCNFDGNQCSLDAYCKHFFMLGWRCWPVRHTDSGVQNPCLQGWQYNSRSEAVYRRVVAWTQAIPDGAPCTLGGPRCSLGLECKLVDAKKDMRICVQETIPEDVGAPEKAAARTKFSSVLIDRVGVASDFDGIAKGMKDRSSFGAEFCESIYRRVAAKCEACRVLVLPLHGKSFTLRISRVKFHAKVYFSIIPNFVNEYAIWLYKAGTVDLDNWMAGVEWCLRE